MAIDLDKVLVTGADGMVGHYIDFGVKTNHRVLDVTDLKEVLNIGQKHKFQAIIHLAAETDVDRCERDPEYAYLVNGIGTYNVAILAKKLGIKLIYISTAGVFDGKNENPYTENDIPNPQNYYGRSKYVGELVVKGMLDDYIIARVCWMFGGGPKKDQKFIAKIINQFDNKEINAVTDQVGSPTFAKDLVSALKKIILENKRGIFNLANKGVCSRYEVACEIVKILQADVRVIPATMSFFKLEAPRTLNEGLISKLDIVRPWQAALKEYLEEEWKPFLRSKKYA
ncbi:MAG: NAD(P)-dependent oxidoreductase [bacterium]|nr:NAD(P)-dependent oxidoreductase [bacterium]